MIVIRAATMGMCFGVRDALKITQQIDSPQEITIYGELVHNEEVIQELHQRGFQSIPEHDRSSITASKSILITAHGISNKERDKLMQSGKILIDTTCPLVQYVHKTAQHMQKNGYFIIIIGQPGHVEIRGLTGDLQDYIVVNKIDAVQIYDKNKIAIICQTTTPPQLAYQIYKEIQRKNPHRQIKYINTICHPTRDRQDAMNELLDKIDVMVVVGGKHSNNTLQLVQLAKSRYIPVYHIQNADEIEPEWFQEYNIVGLTAGTSTLDKTVEEVYQRLLSLEGKKIPLENQVILPEVMELKA